MPASNIPEAMSPEKIVEDLASDVRGVLSSKDLESLPELKALRQRVESRLETVRALAAEKARLAAMRTREAAYSANKLAHDHPYQVGLIGVAFGLLAGLAVSGIFAQRLPGKPTTRAPLTRRKRR